MPARKRLGQLLVDLKIIDEHQLQSALGHQKQWGGKLGGILVQKGFCGEDQVLGALSQHLGMPAVRLGEVKPDARAVKTIARTVAEKLHVFAYEISGSGRHEVVSVAMSDPTDLSAIDQLAFHTGKRIKPMLAGDSDVALAIQQHYGEAAKPAAQQRPTPAATHNPFATASGEPPAPPEVTPRTGTPAAGTPRTAPPAAAEQAEERAAPAPAGDLPADAPFDGLEPVAAQSEPDGAADSRPPLEDPAALQGWTERPQEEVAEWSDDVAAGSVDQLPADAIVGEASPAEAQPSAPDGWHDDADPLAAGAADEWGVAETAAAPADAVAGEADVEVTFDEETVTEDGASPPPASFEEEQLLAEVHAAAESYAEARPAAEEPEAPAAAEAAQSDAEPDQVEQSGEAPTQQAAEAVADDAGAFLFEEPVAESEASASESFMAEQQDAGSFSAEGAEAPAAAADQADESAVEQVVEAPAGGEPDAGAFVFEDPAGSLPPDEQPAPAEEQPAFAAEEQTGVEQPASASEETPVEEPGSHSLEEPPPQDAAPVADGFWQQPGGDGAQSIETTMRLRFAVPTPDEYEDPDARSTEAWPQPAQGEWFGDAGALSAADLGTLQSLGIDPADPAAALRQIAALVRVLHRRQVIDLDELAAEVRDASAAVVEQPPAEAAEEGPPENHWPET
jgi:Type II secretion system (T2SS), protein E, N-terminal domain